MEKDFNNWNENKKQENSYAFVDSYVLFDILKKVDWLMGAGESIHTVALSWGVAVVSSKKIWCVRRRHQRRVIRQAVSSVAPSSRQRTLKENTALASGVSSIVSRMMLKRTGPVHTNIANPTWMSSEDGRDVEICIIQPPRGLEPLGHGVTGPVPHHADGLRAILT